MPTLFVVNKTQHTERQEKNKKGVHVVRAAEWQREKNTNGISHSNQTTQKGKVNDEKKKYKDNNKNWNTRDSLVLRKQSK